MKYYIKGLSSSKESSSSSSDTDTAGTPSYTNWNYRKLCLHVTLGHVWNHRLKYSRQKHDGCASAEALLVSLMSDNCLNLSGYGTGPHAACFAKRVKKKMFSLALCSSVSSILTQSRMGFKESLMIPCSSWRTSVGDDDHWPQVDNDDCLIRSLSLAWPQPKLLHPADGNQ